MRRVAVIGDHRRAGYPWGGIMGEAGAGQPGAWDNVSIWAAEEMRERRKSTIAEHNHDSDFRVVFVRVVPNSHT